MKEKPIVTLIASFLLLAPSQSEAQIPDGLEGYTHYFELDPNSPGDISLVGTVGSWSWQDSRLGDGVFWRHQSDWIAFNLAAPANVRISVERHDEGDNSKFFPSMTLYRAFNNTTEGAHFASNTSDIQWDPNSNILGYLDHHDNFSLGSMDETFQLEAGNYTILLGGNAAAEAQAVNVNYAATFAASAIPEPSTTLLGILAAGCLAGYRNRFRIGA